MPERSYPIAHRGCSRMHRENTMEALAAAVLRCDVVELDVRATSDCVLVCMHDRTLTRTHGQDVHVGRMTWDELRECAPDVPRLEDVLAHLGADAGWIIDCKVSRPRAIDELVRVVASVGMSWDSSRQLRSGEPLAYRTAAFESPDAGLLQAFRARTGAGCLELIRGSSPAAELALTAPFITAYAQGVTIPDRLATSRMLRMLSALRLGTYVYTVNDQQRFDELAEAGASAVFTDDVPDIS